MMLEEALIARLRQSAFTAPLLPIGRVSGLPTVSWFERQRDDAPLNGSLTCITLTPISPGREYDHSGAVDLAEARVQFDFYADTSSAAVALKRAAIREMEREVTITVPGAPGVAVWFEHAQLDGEGFSMGGEEDGGGRVFRVSQDFMIFYSTPL